MAANRNNLVLHLHADTAAWLYKRAKASGKTMAQEAEAVIADEIRRDMASKFPEKKSA
jgi:hypothetical protein